MWNCYDRNLRFDYSAEEDLVVAKDDDGASARRNPLLHNPPKKWFELPEPEEDIEGSDHILGKYDLQCDFIKKVSMAAIDKHNKLYGDSMVLDEIVAGSSFGDFTETFTLLLKIKYGQQENSILVQAVVSNDYDEDDDDPVDLDFFKLSHLCLIEIEPKAMLFLSTFISVNRLIMHKLSG
ncbi:hypothetical protein ACHQM5_017192 [Ranunculus cassubicifolius]